MRIKLFGGPLQKLVEKIYELVKKLPKAASMCQSILVKLWAVKS